MTRRGEPCSRKRQQRKQTRKKERKGKGKRRIVRRREGEKKIENARNMYKREAKKEEMIQLTVPLKRPEAPSWSCFGA